MELNFKNSSMERIYILDKFKSLIWIDRYWKNGSLSVACTPTNEILEKLNDSLYFDLPGYSLHQMILDTIAIKSDIKDGNLLKFQGRSLESILDRRIVWEPTVLSGNLQTEVLSLVTDNLIDTGVTPRNIPNWAVLTSTDPAITSLTIDTQFDGKYTLYKAINEICEAYEIGFRVYYDEGTGFFNFKLYAGLDRSYDQSTNQPVAFTSKLNNLINADYVESGVPEKNVCLVAGEEGIGNIRTYMTVGSGLGIPHSGLDRKETYIEPNINRNVPGGEMSDMEYQNALIGKGEEELGKRKYLVAFDGEVDTSMYNYKDDFDMGDILQIADDYGHETKSRVVEMVFSEDADGEKLYPVFETVE
jgi:hypothetical protein